MIYVKKIIQCDECGDRLATKLTGEIRKVNREASELMYRNGWRFDGIDLVLCRSCAERKRRDEQESAIHH